MATKVFVFISLLAFSSVLHAENRDWKSADGKRSVRGEFVKRDGAGVTIRRTDRQVVTIPLDRLHADDRAWLVEKHPLPGEEPPKPKLDPWLIFKELRFGDTREAVLQKLKVCKWVELTVGETFLGRTGFNGVFRAKETIGGLDATLSFDWSDDQLLKEVIIQTDGLPASQLKDKLEPCWKSITKQMTAAHGNPIHENPVLKLDPIQDGAMQGTHLWDVKGSGTIMLGAARDGDHYQIAVRFTEEKIKPVPIAGS